MYALSWSPDGKRAITASGDKTVKLWDIEANTAVTTFTFGDDLEWQQLGCLWQGSTMISVSLNGYINYLDPNEPSRPRMTVKGSVKAATALAAKPDAGHFYAGSYDGESRGQFTRLPCPLMPKGRIMNWDISKGSCEVIKSNAHGVLGLKVQGDNLLAATLDDAIRVAPLTATEIPFAGVWSYFGIF